MCLNRSVRDSIRQWANGFSHAEVATVSDPMRRDD
jgi:hypothetical protein